MRASKTRQFRSINYITKNCSNISLTIILLASLSVMSLAQTASRPDRGVGTLGSYSISDIENINLTNGNVNLSIPLAALPPVAGGDLSWALHAEYNSKMWDRFTVEIPPGQPPTDGITEFTLQLGDGGWRIGKIYEMEAHTAEEDYEPTVPIDPSDPEFQLGVYRWKILLTTPDGAKHELRPLDYPVYPGGLEYRVGYYKDRPDSVNATMRYYSFDGSYIWAKIDPGYLSSWTVYLPDGATIEQSNGIQRIKDTNGNKIKIFSEVVGTITTTHYQDELTGREIKHIHDSATNTGQVQYQTVGGAWVSIDINWGITHVQGLVYSTGRPCFVDRVLEADIAVVRSIVLPLTKPGAPRQQYTFSYNSDTTDTGLNVQWRRDCFAPMETITSASHGWGSLSQMVTPQGATVNYDYSLTGVYKLDDSQRAPAETIVTKTVNHDGMTDTWIYGVDTLTGSSSEVKGPDGSITTQYTYPHDPGLALSLGGNDGKAGLVYRTVRKLGPDSSPIAQTTVERHWTKLIFSGGYDHTVGGLVGFNTVVDAEYTTVHDPSGGLAKMSARTFQHDYNGNVTQIIEYDWFDPSLVSRDAAGVPTGVPGSATILRVTTNNYYNPAASSTSANVYAKRVLPSGAPLILNAIQDTAAGPSQTLYSYDNQAYGVAPTLGNLTKVSRLDDSVSPSRWLNTTYGYDSYGNRTSITDPNNNVTNIAYDSATHSRPTQVTVDPLNGTGVQTVTTVYDNSTGLVTSVTDPNNQTTDTDYTNQLLGTTDPFMRPGVVTGPPVTSYVNGVTYANQRRKTRLTYDDNLRQATVESDLNTSGDYKLKSRTTSDEMGRVVLTERNEDGTGSYTISSQRIYAQIGKITLASNPQRSAAAATDGWTRTTRDELGRVVEVATFSSATRPPNTGTNSAWTGSVTTSYNANQTTVTDQAGKTRRSETDALGRLVKVTEAPGGPS